MSKSRFEQIGNEAVEVYPALQKQLERLYVDQIEGVLHVLVTAGLDAADGLIAGMVTKWGKDTIDLKQKFALGYYSQGYNLAEILCMKEYNARGKSLLAFGSTTIAGMQTKGDLVDYINKTTIAEVSTKAKQISKIIKDNIDKGADGNYTTLTNTLLQTVASSSKAKQIAHDLTIWSYNQGAHAAYKDMGVTSVEWMATEDERTCPYCSDLDGNITHVDQPFLKAGQVMQPNQKPEPKPIKTLPEEATQVEKLSSAPQETEFVPLPTSPVTSLAKEPKPKKAKPPKKEKEPEKLKILTAEEFLLENKHLYDICTESSKVDGITQCHQGVYEIKQVLGTPANVEYFEWQEEKWKKFGQAIDLVYVKQTIKDQEAINLFEDIKDGSVNGHSFIKKDGHYIDPFLYSSGVSQKEIDATGAYMEKLYIELEMVETPSKETVLASKKKAEEADEEESLFGKSSTADSLPKSIKPFVAYANIQHAPLHPYCRCTVVPVLDENFDKEQKDQQAKKKSKFAKVNLSPKTQVKTALDLPKGSVFSNDTLVLGSDGLVYVVTNDPNDSKIDLMGGGNFDFAYVKPIIQSPKIKKLKSSAMSKLSHTPEAAPPKVQIVPDLAIVEPEEQVETEIKPKLKKGDFVFPTLEDIPNLKVLPTKLNGSMGAKVVQDEFGQKWIFKKSSNTRHLQEEVTADELYNLLGGRAPRSKYYEKDGVAYKLSEFIEGGIELGELLRTNPAMYARARKKIQAQIALNAYLGNDDAVGMEMGNIMVTFEKGEPVIWNVDNGGSMRYRAQGGIKESARFNPHVAQLWSYRKNSDTMVPIFGTMSYTEVNNSMTDLMQHKTKMEEWLANHPDAELKELLGKRLKAIEEYWDIGSDLIHDDFLDTYADKFVYYYMDIDRKNAIKRFPEFLNQRGDSKSPTLEDENGVKWDNLRGRDSVSSDIADYIDTIGDWNIVQKWAEAQYNSSFSRGSMEMKAWVASKRTTELKDYFWNNDIGHATDNSKIASKYRVPGNEKYDESMTAWHAFNLHMMRKIEMPYVNKAKRTISLVRTEDSTLLRPSNPSYKKHADGTVTYRQTPYVSASLMNAVAPLGLDAVITAEMPQHRALCFWFLSQRNTSHGILHYENENEVVMIPDKIRFTRLEQSFSKLASQPAKPKSEEALRIDKKILSKIEEKRRTQAEKEVKMSTHEFVFKDNFENEVKMDKDKFIANLKGIGVDLDKVESVNDLPGTVQKKIQDLKGFDKETAYFWIGLTEKGASIKKLKAAELAPLKLSLANDYLQFFSGPSMKSMYKKEVFKAVLDSLNGDDSALNEMESKMSKLSHLNSQALEIFKIWEMQAKKISKDSLAEVLGIKEEKPTVPESISVPNKNGSMKNLTKDDVLLYMADVNVIKTEDDLAPIKHWYNAASPNQKIVIQKWLGVEKLEKTKEEKKAATEAKVKAMLDKAGEKIAKKVEKKKEEETKKKFITLKYHKNALDLTPKEKKNFDDNLNNLDIFVEHFKLMAEEEGEELMYFEGMNKITMLDPDAAEEDDNQIIMTKKEFAEWLAVTPPPLAETMMYTLDPESVALVNVWLEELN